MNDVGWFHSLYCTLVSGCLRGERQEMILLVELLKFVCHDEWCTEQTYA